MLDSDSLEGRAARVLTDAAQILDTVSREWGATGEWSGWDQSVRDEITAWLKDFYAQAVGEVQ